MFFRRVDEIPIERAGLVLGVATGGIAADAWRRRNPRGRLYFAMLASTLSVPLLPWLLNTESTTLALVLDFPLAMAGSM